MPGLKHALNWLEQARRVPLGCFELELEVRHFFTVNQHTNAVLAGGVTVNDGPGVEDKSILETDFALGEGGCSLIEGRAPAFGFRRSPTAGFCRQREFFAPFDLASRAIQKKHPSIGLARDKRNDTLIGEGRAPA